MAHRCVRARALRFVVFVLTAFCLAGPNALAASRPLALPHPPLIAGPVRTAPRVISANVWTVNSVADTADGTCDGTSCTLREALENAQAGDTIAFSSLFDTPQTIALGSALPDIAGDLTITGPGASLLTVRAQATGFSVLYISAGVVNISGLTIAGGSVADGAGINNFGSLTLTDSVITDNHSSGNGGGVQNGGSLSIVRSTISGNSAFDGGGLLNYASGGNTGTATLINTTISGNTGIPYSGGIENINYGATAPPSLSLLNCTIVDNVAPEPGGISTDDEGGSVTTTLKNTIVANNLTPNLKAYNANAVVISLGNNLADDDGGGFLNGAGDKTGTDPLLSELGNFGGPVPTHLLGRNSPAIDAGNNSGAPATDQRGVARPQGSSVDIGAVELHPLVVTTTADPGDGSCDGTCSLHDAIAAANGDGTTADDIFFSSLFDSAQTINLAGALPDIAGDLTLNGPGANLLTVRRDSGGDYGILVVDAGVAASISGATISNGNRTQGGGGVANYGRTSITDCTITGNTGGGGGGVLSIGARLAVERSTISGNQANDGAGIFIESPTIAALSNCTISGNSAAGYTGGITVLAGGSILADVALSNCTIANNVGVTEDSLSVVDNDNVSPATASLANTILKRTALANISLVNFNASLTSLGHNLADDGGSGELAAGGDQTNTDPRLATLSNYGGTTPTLFLKPGSPALDTGDDSAAPATDQRGVARPQGAHVDIGSVESDGILIFQDGFDAPQ